MTSPAEHIDKAAKVAYDAYSKAAGGVSVRGEPLPKWDDMPERIRACWRESARAFTDFLEGGDA